MTGNDRQRLSQEDRFQALLRTCPDLSEWVEEFDLINPETGVRFGVSPIPEEKRQKLSSIAGNILNRGRIYTSEQVVSLIEEKLRVSRTRAVNGFRMMIDSGVLTAYSGAGVSLSM